MSDHEQHLDELVDRFPDLTVCRSDIQRVYEVLRECFEVKGGKLLLCGNGGSAADAEHWAGELLKGFRRQRPVSERFHGKMPAEYVGQLQGAMPAVPLTGFLSLQSAYANDVAPALVFAQLVWALGEQHDVLAGISTSGNALNVCHALRVARALGMVTVGLTGAEGGALNELCDVVIRVPVRETYLVQEYHLPVYHTLSLMLESALFPH